MPPSRGISPCCRREVVTVMRRRLNRMGSALPGKLRHLQVSALGSEMFRLSSLHILRLSRHILAASVKTAVRTPAAWRWCRWPRCGGSSARCPCPRSRCAAPPRTDTWTRAARGTRPRQELRIDPRHMPPYTTLSTSASKRFIRGFVITEKAPG